VSSAFFFLGAGARGGIGSSRISPSSIEESSPSITISSYQSEGRGNGKKQHKYTEKK
jgi:hypothetical protein